MGNRNVYHFLGLLLPPVLFLLWMNQSIECVIALGICNLVALIFMALGILGEALEKKERRTLFLSGCYYSLFSLVFLYGMVEFMLQESIEHSLIVVFVLIVVGCFCGNVKGSVKYKS